MFMVKLSLLDKEEKQTAANRIAVDVMQKLLKQYEDVLRGW